MSSRTLSIMSEVASYGSLRATEEESLLPVSEEYPPPHHHVLQNTPLMESSPSSTTMTEPAATKPSYPTNNVLMTIVMVSMIYLIALGHSILSQVKGARSTTNLHQNLLHFPSLSAASSKLFDPDFPSSTSSPSSTPAPQGDHEVVSTTTTTTTTTSILIVYVAQDPGQELMAKEVANGARAVPHTNVVVANVTTATLEQVLQADGVILGASVENGNAHPSLLDWMDTHWDISKDLSCKVGGAFVTAGGISAGQESTLQALTRAMMVFRMIIVGGDSWESALGAAAVTAEAPYKSLTSRERRDHRLDFNEACYQHEDQVIHPRFLQKARSLGTRVATVAHQLKGCKV